MPKTLGFTKPEVKLPKQLHPSDNRFFQMAVKNQQSDGIPTVYMSPFNGKTASISPAEPPMRGTNSNFSQNTMPNGSGKDNIVMQRYTEKKGKNPFGHSL